MRGSKPSPAAGADEAARRAGAAAAARQPDGMAARHVQATIVDQHELDFPEKLNTSSYVTVVEEPEEENVALVGLKVNLADQTVREYSPS